LLSLESKNELSRKDSLIGDIKLKKLIRNLFFVSILVLGVLPLSTITNATVKADPTEIAIIYATGGLGDKSFNDAAERGKIMAEEEYGDDLVITYVEPQTIPEFATYQDDLAKEDKYALIICVGFLQTSALEVSAETYPNQDWLLIDAVLNKTNVRSITFKEHEGSFLVGAMAAMVTQTEKLGFLGGLDIYLINKFRYGYVQGAKYINPNISVKAVYSPDPTNPWGDIAGGKTVGTTFYADGYDVVYAAAGGTGIGVMQAANETDDVYAIGVDSDQDYIVKGKVLCSMLKLVENAVFTTIEVKMEDTWRDGLSDTEYEQIELGIKEGGVGISEMKHTTAIKNGDYTFDGKTKTRWEHIEDIIEKIEKGHLIVSDSTGKYSEDIPTPGFELYVLLVLLGLAVFQIRRRRR